MRRCFGALLMLGVFASSESLARPITIEDVMRFKTVVAMEPAVDGVVAQVQEWDGGPKFLKDLWWIRQDKAPRRLTYGGKTSSAFAVSPKGDEIAFFGERDGRQGIFVLPITEGGEARLLAELPLDVDNLIWAGDLIYFTAFVFPDCGQNLECTANRLKERKNGPSGMVYDDLYMRPWNMWSNGTYQNLFALSVSTKEVRGVAIGPFHVPTLPFGGREDITISPDGTAVVYAAKKGVNLALSTNTDLFIVENGSERPLVTTKGAERAPKFSPDGKMVAFLAQEVENFESDKWRLKVLDLATGTTFTLAPSIDNWVIEYVWSPDGKHIYFTVDEQGYLLLYRVEVRPEAAPVRVGPRITTKSLAFSRDGKTLYCLREAMTAPPDVFALTLDKKGRVTEKRLSDFNSESLRNLEMPVVEEVWYDGAEVAPGKRQRVHAFVVRPRDASADRKYPLVVMIHGGPQGAWHSAIHPRWTPLGIVGHGFVVIMPNITGSTGYGQDFVNAVSRDWGGKPFQDIMALLDFAGTLPYVDSSRACAMGGSYGGYLVNFIEGQTDRFRCLVSHSGPFNLESKYGSTDELWFPEWDIGGTPWDNPEAYAKWSPHRYARNFKTPMLVIHGQNDFRVPVEQGLQTFTTLRRLGVEARLLYFPDEDHFVSKPLNRKLWYDTVVDWLRSHLYGDEARKAGTL